ncbi:hypothetical protein N2152v2_007470 [Parachlorella kessleri]
MATVGAQPIQPVPFHRAAARADWVGSLLSIALLLATLVVMRREGQVVDPRANYLWGVAASQLTVRWALGARHYEAQRSPIIFAVRLLAMHSNSVLHPEQVPAATAAACAAADCKFQMLADLLDWPFTPFLHGRLEDRGGRLAGKNQLQIGMQEA